MDLEGPEWSCSSGPACHLQAIALHAGEVQSRALGGAFLLQKLLFVTSGFFLSKYYIINPICFHLIL